MIKTALISGGYGFVGRFLVEEFLRRNYKVINIDKITYASKKYYKFKIKNKKHYHYKIDINNIKKLKNIFLKFNPTLILNCAAESHVDESIKFSKKFLNTNILGTYSMLEATKFLNNTIKKKIKFIQISTDEVYGDIKKGHFANENNILKPSSPYSSSKSSAEHLVMSWGRTYNIPFLITRSCNNYGPYQHEEKLIPTCIISILKKKKIPIYGKGDQMREWIYVYDNAKKIAELSESNYSNEIFNIGSGIRLNNLNLVNLIYLKIKKIIKYKEKISDFINFVKDRKGHDYRYALDCKKFSKFSKIIHNQNFDKALNKTIKWYINLKLK